MSLLPGEHYDKENKKNRNYVLSRRSPKARLMPLASPRNDANDKGVSQTNAYELGWTIGKRAITQ
jgi:hypothetical protein